MDNIDTSTESRIKQAHLKVLFLRQSRVSLINVHGIYVQKYLFSFFVPTMVFFPADVPAIHLDSHYLIFDITINEVK